MRVVIIGGGSEDEAQLRRIIGEHGYALDIQRPGAAANESEPGQISAATGTSRELPLQPRAFIFESPGELDLAFSVLHALRQEPDFDAVSTLLVLSLGDAVRQPLPGGFDDFVLDSASAEELGIRLSALASRRVEFGRLRSTRLEGIVVDETSRSAHVGGQVVKLTAREYALFTHFCEWRGQILSREHLLTRVWGGCYSGGRRTVDIHVRRLRAKLGAALPLETLRGRGYRLGQGSQRRDSVPPQPAAELYPDVVAAE